MNVRLSSHIPNARRGTMLELSDFWRLDWVRYFVMWSWPLTDSCCGNEPSVRAKIRGVEVVSSECLRALEQHPSRSGHNCDSIVVRSTRTALQGLGLG